MGQRVVFLLSVIVHYLVVFFCCIGIFVFWNLDKTLRRKDE